VRDFETEEQQVEELKRWWKENGKVVMIGIVIGAVAIVGGKSYLNHLQAQRVEASMHYDRLNQALAAKQVDMALSEGEQIVTQYPKTVYAAMASLALAKMRVEKGELSVAENRLRWVIDHAGQNDIVHTARLRLARVLVADGKYDIALNLINGVAMDGYTPLYQELLGDIYLAKKQPDKARNAYAAALEAMDSGDDRQTVQMKLDDLGA
jgi:predicted negative regulator of RcsB-dependent stress response